MELTPNTSVDQNIFDYDQKSGVSGSLSRLGSKEKVPLIFNPQIVNPIQTNCVWINKNSSSISMTKVYLSWWIMFDMVCEPL